MDQPNRTSAAASDSHSRGSGLPVRAPSRSTTCTSAAPSLIQRAALADEMDDHLADCPAMAQALLAKGATLQARTLTGAVLSDLARDAGLALT